MKANFKCPKCKKGVVVGKKLHASYTCPNCHYAMVLSREDVNRGWKPFRPMFQSTEGLRPRYKKFQKIAKNSDV